MTGSIFNRRSFIKKTAAGAIGIGLSGTTLDNQTESLLTDFRESLGFLNCRIGCNLCERSCPNHIPVNTIMRYFYYSQVLQEKESAARLYSNSVSSKAYLCKNCTGVYETAWPQNVAIRELLNAAHHLLT